MKDKEYAELLLQEWRNEQTKKQKSKDMKIIYDFIDLIKRTEY